ncbi:MAG: flagellar biosynthesis protein FliQ [Acidimicrobiia bacterium]|nr:flagellar biosynthesis protein FliQ [Acidimicrobiia bacterium]MDH5520058.1 flagellar biosynthesis protein FliQ [Acidimicrobiia bacterium]
MTETQAIEIVSEAIWIAARISAPILVTAIAVGVAVGLLQSVTQLQEQTLSFVPKFIAVGAVIVISGSWMIQQMVAYTIQLYDSIPGLLG